MPTSKSTMVHAARCAILWIAFGAAVAQAGVTIDGTLRPAATLSGPNYQINEAHGVRAGANLFQSFGQFSLATGESATFNGSAGIANIIGRVTGGGLSLIDGSIISTISGANLYLVNPAGFVFGPNASLNVSGSFYASSASYIRLADNSVFHAVNPSASTLTAAALAAFGFLGPAGSITVSGAQLAVPSGKTLGLVGGDVTVQDGGLPQTLSARSGRIDIASAAASGEVTIGASGLDASGVSAQGTVTLTGSASAPLTNSTIEVSELSSSLGGGSIAIRGGRIVLNNAKLRANTVNGNAGSIELAARDELSVSGGVVTSVTTGAGNAGTLLLSARTIGITNGALVDTSCDPGCTTGAGGALTVSASERISISGASADTTGVVSNTLGGGRAGAVSLAAPVVDLDGNALVQSVTISSGAATGVSLNAARLSVTNGAQIDADTRGAGAGGALDITASDSLTINGVRFDSGTQQKIPSGLFANTFGPAAGGAIRVHTGALSVTGGGEISSSSGTGASGNGGAIEITATGPVLVSGTDGATKSSAIVANTFSTGTAGRISITTPSLVVSNDGRIQAQSQAGGASSDIELNVGSLTLSGHGQVSTDARASGAGGTIRADVAGGISISGFDSGLFAKAYATGAGGSVIVTADTLSLSDRSGLFAGTDGTGAGGNIRVTTRSSAALNSGSSIASRSTLLGIAGEINLDAGSKLLLTDSSITTEARRADGGNIAIHATELVSLLRSQITTAVGTGFGNGGNITIDPSFLVLNQSSIIANAFGGNGGNINITAGQFLRSPDSVVSASSLLGVSGTIVISSPPVDVSGSLAELPVSYLDAAALLTNPCAARLAGKASSLVLAGRGGVPYSGEGYLPLFASSQPLPLLAGPGIQSVASAAGLDVYRLARCSRG